MFYRMNEKPRTRDGCQSLVPGARKRGHQVVAYDPQVPSGGPPLSRGFHLFEMQSPAKWTQWVPRYHVHAMGTMAHKTRVSSAWVSQQGLMTGQRGSARNNEWVQHVGWQVFQVDWKVLVWRDEGQRQAFQPSACCRGHADGPTWTNSQQHVVYVPGWQCVRSAFSSL